MRNMIIRSFFWKSLERASVVAIQFIVQLVLARLLLPEDYGTVTVVAAVIAILNVVLQSGITKSLIQFKRANSKYFATALLSNFVLSLFLYGLLFFASPSFELLVHIKGFSHVARILGLSIIIGSFSTIQEACLIRHADYKSIFAGYLSGAAISGIVAIIAASMGIGYWALVVQQLVNQLVCAVVFGFRSPFRPRWFFSLMYLWKMLSYSWKITLSTFIDILFSNSQSIMLGRLFSARTLGFLTKGQQFPLLIAANIDSIIQSIMLRELSRRQERLDDYRAILKKIVVIASFFVFPAFAVLIANSESIVVVLLSERWKDSSIYLVFYGLAYCYIPFSSINIQVPNSMGKSKLYLRNEIAKKTLGVVFIAVGLISGIRTFCLSLVLYGIVSFIIDTATTGSLTGYGIPGQLRDMAPYAILAITACLVAFPIRFLHVGIFIQLVLSVILSISLYISAAGILHLRGFSYAKSILSRNGKIDSST